MTTPNIEELIAHLCEGFYHGGSANVLKAAEALQSQAERIKELEAEVGHKALVIAWWRDKHDTLLAESETQAKAYGLAIVEHHQLRAENDRLSLHIKNIGNDALRTENANLRSQLSEIAATEPVAWMMPRDDDTAWASVGSAPLEDGMIPLFTRPMPAQEVNAEHVPLSDEQIEQAVKTYGVVWTGYREDAHGFYTIPILSPYHYRFARAIESTIAKGAK